MGLLYSSVLVQIILIGQRTGSSPRSRRVIAKSHNLVSLFILFFIILLVVIVDVFESRCSGASVTQRSIGIFSSIA